jgi:hypothetical protein
MGWRFRRSFKVIPGVRLNLSKSGASPVTPPPQRSSRLFWQHRCSKETKMSSGYHNTQDWKSKSERTTLPNPPQGVTVQRINNDYVSSEPDNTHRYIPKGATSLQPRFELVQVHDEITRNLQVLRECRCGNAASSAETT